VRVTYTVCAFCTVDTPYESEAEEMAKTARAVGLANIRIDKVANLGGWNLNTYYKARWIAGLLDEIEVGGILTVDVDARFRQRPTLFDEDDWQADFAAHHFRGVELNSAALWWQPSDKTRDLVRRWIEINDIHIKTPVPRFEQHNLRQALAEHRDRLTFVELPASYCQIFDLQRDEGAPVIEQMQASRRYKKVVGP
jgi:hypothetical protein